MARNFNENFINEFSIKNYQDTLKDTEFLKRIFNNYNYRFDPAYNTFDGQLNLLKESLDHYVLKAMKEDKNFINSIECNNYFTYLKNLSNHNDYEYHTNVVLSNVLNNDEFIKYKQKYIGNNLNVFNEKINNNTNRLNSIFNQIKNNKEVSQNELNLICGVLSDYRENCEVMRHVIKYIFNNLTKQDNKLKCSPQILSAILTYIPYMSDKIKKNGFRPSAIRFCVTNKIMGKDFSGVGVSLGDNSIIISGKKFSNIDFKSIRSIESTYLKDVDKYNDFSMLMIVAFHEITHKYQKYMSRLDVKASKYNNDFLTDGYAFAVSRILNESLNDYGENHDNDDIEIHATKVGWEMCADFYTKMIDNQKLREKLTERCMINKNSTQSRHSFATKKDQNGNIVDKNKYDNNNLIKIFSDKNKREKWFNLYPHLRQVFTPGGKFNIDILFIYNFGYTRYGSSLFESLINTKGIDDIISSHIKNNGYSKDKLRIASDNIYLGIKNATSNIRSIEYYTRFSFNDEFKVNKDLLDVAKEILDNQVITIKNGKRILHNVLKCHEYDTLIDDAINISKAYYKAIINSSNVVIK